MALFNKQENTRMTPAATDARGEKADNARSRAPSMLGMATDPNARPTHPTNRTGRVEQALTEEKTEKPRESAGASKLIVGPDIGLKGAEITDCDTLVVEGRVKAQMKSRVIEIAEGGTFEGTVEVEEAIISGRFDGQLTARSRLYVHPTGEVTGTIRYGRLAVEEGGRVTGDLGQEGAVKPSTAVDSDKTEEAKKDEGASGQPETRAAE